MIKREKAQKIQFVTRSGGLRNEYLPRPVYKEISYAPLSETTDQDGDITMGV